MRIGFASIYPWRPHVEHLFYLSQLAKQEQHEVSFFTCDANLPTCYNVELKSSPQWLTCLKCRVGGIRSYTDQNVKSIGDYQSHQSDTCSSFEEWSYSSASTLGRFESDENYKSEAFMNLVHKLIPSVKEVYHAALQWIDSEKLDALCVFNCRMDVTRAIYEAAQTRNKLIISVERTAFGDGLLLLPNENCLGLKSLHKMNQKWKDKPLTRNQALRATNYMALRFLNKNTNEWRAYNLNAKTSEWPAKGKRRILLLPGSRNEFYDHPDWQSPWDNPLEAYEALINGLKLNIDDVVLRCHPNWGENIGKNTGLLAENYYSQWANSQGIHVIGSTETIKTSDLIKQCDAIVVAFGSGALEAGLLGKQVISISNSNYIHADFADKVFSVEEANNLILNIDKLPSEQAQLNREVIRQTLRYIYTITHRVPQFTDHILQVKTTQYCYKAGVDASRFTKLLTTGILSEDDIDFANNEIDEDEIIDLINEEAWDNLLTEREEFLEETFLISRKQPFTLLDKLRGLLPRGDR